MMQVWADYTGLGITQREERAADERDKGAKKR
jgi:hypothetical protein